MNDAVTVPAKPEAARPAPIPLRELWPWALFGTLLLAALMYLVAVEGSAVALGPGEFIHELMHDGRHLLTVPCH